MASGYIPRVVDAEIDQLFGELPAIALEGPKAVGKTETARQRAATEFMLDDPHQREVAQADLDRLLQATTPILIDEWQHLPAVWDRVRRSVDHDRTPGRFLLTGSSSPHSVGPHTGALRIVSLRMRPLSLAERLVSSPTVSLAALLTGQRPAVTGRTAMRVGDYTDEILRSGFPGIRHLTDRPRRRQLDGYLGRVIDRDFPELGHEVRNPAALRRWLAAYASATATTASFETIRDAASAGQTTKTSRAAAAPYRDVLERLFILDPLPGWSPTRARINRLTMPPKHHLADPALAVRLLGITRDTLLRGESAGPEIVRDGTLLGALFDSLVTLSIRTYAQAAEASVSHFRTRGGEHEADVIVDRGDGGVVAFEIKLAGTADARATRHLSWLQREIGDELLDAVLITAGGEAFRRQDGIAVVPAALLGP